MAGSCPFTSSLWLLRRGDASDEQEVLSLPATDGTDAVVLFTDPTLAMRTAMQAGEGYAPVQINTVGELVDLLRAAVNMGDTHVAVDPQARAKFYLISEVLRMLQDIPGDES
jgi:hypothetical protein